LIFWNTSRIDSKKNLNYLDKHKIGLFLPHENFVKVDLCPLYADDHLVSRTISTNLPNRFSGCFK